jgi:hypothetical protein
MERETVEGVEKIFNNSNKVVESVRFLTCALFLLTADRRLTDRI